MEKKTLVGLMAAVLAAAAQAYTVYDAGKALCQNCTNGTYANPYTDANGGAFNGLTLVGALPAYVPTSTFLFVR